ncbi:helix-hairpin-helix domain-containing protein [Comamonas sp.]|uniref:helix-hairpin-helix domain-containing protein n=1 Tax=Comamonas sp. TaxID=34028 RepID=UPI002896CAE6|nr:helix-hairpin-helix domain-containing protein [Comamonas sp.]
MTPTLISCSKCGAWGCYGSDRSKQSSSPAESFTPTRVYSPIRHIKGSSLNGTLSPAAVRALARGGITTMDQLLATERKELMNIKGLGALKLQEIERVFFPGQHN